MKVESTKRTHTRTHGIGSLYMFTTYAMHWMRQDEERKMSEKKARHRDTESHIPMKLCE